jgi:hypothetical protein
MTTQYCQVVTKILVGGAVLLGVCVGGVAPAGADPNPFGGLSCGCRDTAPAGSADPRADIDRGLLEGHSAWLPGLPAPAESGQPPH